MFGWLVHCLGGNGLSTATCKSILQLFDGEKIAKAVRGSNAAAKAWLREDFAQNTHFFSSTTFTQVTALLLRRVHATYGKIAARQARGWGWYLSKIYLSQFQLLCHVTLRSA